jgi:hypothetical protein
MLLKTIRKRLEARRDDDGAVLMSVIAIMAVMMIISITLTSAAITSTGYSTASRAQVQSRASAEAGIDLVWAGMQKGTFYCSLSAADANGVTYSATVDYFDAANLPLTCSGTSTLSGTPARGVVNSLGKASARGVAGATSGDERALTALFDIKVNAASVTLDKVFFSDGSYTITNSTNVLDATGLSQANLYSNGTIDCSTTIALQGSVYVQGDFKAHNKCIIAGTVWAGGAVTSDDQMQVLGDVYSQGGATGTPSSVSLNKAWVGGTVVANGSVSLEGNANTNYCSLAATYAKVCGGVVSIEGGITISNGGSISGNALAKNGIDIGTTNDNLIVGGNLVSTTGGLTGSNFGNKGSRVGGYIAVGGTTQLPKERIGNAASSCAATTGFAPCKPAQPPLPLGGLPATLNFPTNTRVVSPPRESLPRIESTASALAKWTGWTQESVTCTNVTQRIKDGWTGKLMLNVTGCTAPVQWDNQSFAMPGDLVVMSPTGFTAKNDLTFTSSTPGSTTKRTLMLIVPSDSKKADGSNLVTWTAPIATDPAYTRPTCAAGEYGGIVSSKISTVNVQTFLYTACYLEVQNQLLNFFGQIYSGSSKYPNNSSITFTPISVPGATTATAVATPSIVVGQTSRFDSRD